MNDTNEEEFLTTRSLLPGRVRRPTGSGWKVRRVFDLESGGHAPMVYILWSRIQGEDSGGEQETMTEDDLHIPTIDRCVAVCERLKREMASTDRAQSEAIAIVQSCIKALKL